MNAQIVLENLEVRFPERVLFENVNWTLYEGMRVALAGRNGCGKSTLLRILAGQAEPTHGSRNVVGGRKLRIGYLDQSMLEKAVMEAREQKDQSKNSIDHIKSLLTFDMTDTHDAELEWQISKTLSGLGFSKEQMQSPINHLSGGWLLRTFIAGALLNKPEVLLLDEPTNHLDLSSIQWLEEFLENEYDGSLVLVTHDVSLQKRTTNSLAVVHGGHFYFQTHQQDYLSFRDSLGQEAEILGRQINGIIKKKKELQTFVDKYRAKARMASRAQSKLKQIEKHDEELQELNDRMERIRGFDYNLHLNFNSDKPGSKFPMALEDVSFRYSNDGPWILKDVSLDIKRGQKIAIIGDNGAGKTTLLNVLAGRLEPQEGDRKMGHGLEMGYFGQHQLEELNLEANLVENIRAKAPQASVEQVRSWLGAFGFYGDYEINKPAKVLSGGEKARLAMLRILGNPINLCLLDEPTNHLDIETKELLKNSLKKFDGSVVFVSHDREFVRDIAQRIIYVSVDHQVTDHIGNLNSFFEKYPEKLRHLEGHTPTAKAKPVEAKETQDNKLSYEERKKRKNRFKSLQKKVKQFEKDLERLGAEKEALQKEVEHASFYEKAPEEQQAAFEKSANLDKQINDCMIEWEKCGTELEDLEKDFAD